jgi:hypothetical protein
MMTDAEFQDLMARVDADLQKEGVAIYGRPLCAASEISKRLHMVIGGPCRLPGIPGRYDSLTMEAHIDVWYECRYGDRLKMNPHLGSVVAMIEGDPWRLTCPIFYGTVTFTCDPDKKSHNATKPGEQAVCNILDHIEKFPRTLAPTLSLEELRALLDIFVLGMKTLQELDGVAGNPFIPEALADLESAVGHLLCHPPQYGISQWDSLQFIEKLLKSYLQTNNATYPKKHHLQELADSAKNHGLPALDPTAIVAIQCSPGVRYGEQQVTLTKAITAHHASLQLAQVISGHLSKPTP